MKIKVERSPEALQKFMEYLDQTDHLEDFEREFFYVSNLRELPINLDYTEEKSTYNNDIEGLVFPKSICTVIEEPKFGIRDKIQFFHAREHLYTGEITEMGDGKYLVRISDDGTTVFVDYDEGSIQLVKEEFKVGDYVQYDLKEGRTVEGTIKGIIFNAYKISNDCHKEVDTIFFGDKTIKLVEPKQIIPDATKYYYFYNDGEESTKNPALCLSYRPNGVDLRYWNGLLGNWYKYIKEV